MAEQISFYDKLKSDMVGDAYSAAAKSPKVRAAAQFATDYELGADRPTLVKSLQQGVQEVADSDTPGGTRTLSAQSTADGLIKRLNEIEQRLASPDARMDSSYRARLIDVRNSLANDVRKLDLPAGQSLADSGIRHYSRLAEADRALEERDSYVLSRRNDGNGPPAGTVPTYKHDERSEMPSEASDAFDTRKPFS
jgi:hypothetical protein